MGFFDTSGNEQLGAIAASMPGFIEPPTPREVLTLDMYQFLIQPIRHEDQHNGELFVRRFLEGPQQVWSTTQQLAFSTLDLWSLTKCPDDCLPFLKVIVGWGKDLDFITTRLDSVELRRLIAVSAALWKNRGPEDTILQVLTLLTAKRVRMWNWFDFRFIIDETGTSEEHDGRDPMLIDLPQDGDDEYRSNIRIADDDITVDRQLVLDVLRFLLRPVGERFEVSWITFLELFDQDDSQWDEGTITVEDGVGKLTDSSLAEESFAISPFADSWANLLAFTRVKGTSTAALDEFGLRFYRTDASNFYFVALDVNANTFRLGKVVAGAPTAIASADLVAADVVLIPDVFYGVRVEIVPEAGSNRIRVFLDNDELINELDSSHSLGTLSLFHTAGATLQTDEIELFLNPLDVDTIEINS